MDNMICANCGASIEGGARFCRKCGRPIIYSEATTRELDPPQYVEPQTRPVSAADTSPSFAPMPGLPAYPTQNIEGRGQKRTIIILSAVVAALLVTLLIVLLVGRRESTVATPRAPEVPRPPAGIGPPGRPGPGQQPTTPEAPVADETLDFPGAEKTVTRTGEAEIITLKTDANMDDVVEWYRSKPGTQVIFEVPGESTMLRTGNAMIIIAMDNGETAIVITKGGPDNFPFPPVR
jgi:hypothetical protein